METVESKRRPGTIPDEPVKAGPVGGLYADAGIQAETTGEIPGEPVLGVEGLQEAVAAEMSQDPGTDRVLMKTRIEGGAEAVEGADGSERGVRWCFGTGLPQGGLESPEQDVEDRRGGLRSMMEEMPKAFGQGEDPLADGYVGKDVVSR